MFVVIVIGFIAYIMEKKSKIKRLIAEIEAEPLKYTSNTFNCSSISNELIGRLILLMLIGAIISVPILYFMNNSYYGMMSLIIIILFLALINFSPHYIIIENEKIYYRHLINTLNKTITIPLSRLERITYWEESTIKKILSLNINDFIYIDINIFLMSNYEEIVNSINSYIKNREKIVFPNAIRYNCEEKNIYTTTTELDSRIKVKTSNDYILLIIVLMAIESFIIFNFFFIYHDTLTIIAMLIIPLIMLKLVPYRIYFYGDRIEYKHIIHTKNRIEIIFTNDISNIEIVSKISSFTRYNNRHRNRIRVKHYTLNIYKRNKDIITLNLLYENMGDVKSIVDIVNSRTTSN